MKIFYKLTLAFVAVFSTASAMADNNRMLIRQRTYGDILGTSTSKCTAEKVYYYNNKLQLRRIINTKPGENDLIFQTTDYWNYEYENDLLTDVSQWQYGVYTYGERDVKKSGVGNIKYEYDENGNCISMDDDGLVTTYQYNEQGYRIGMIEGSGRMTKYDELTADGKPLHATVRPPRTRPELLGDSYEEIYEYDTDGNLIRVTRQHDQYLKVAIKNGGITSWDEVYEGEFVSGEEYIYENGFLTEKITYGKDWTYSFADGRCPQAKTIYRMVDGNPNIIHYYTIEYDAWEDKWSTKATVEFEDEYQDFSDYAELENQIVNCTQSTDEVNAARIEFTLPQRMFMDPFMGMNIYRNGEFVQTVYLNDFEAYGYNNLVYNEESTTFTYIDRNLKNGSYEYFVETVRSYEQEGPGIEDEIDGGFGVTPHVYVPSYIVSNVAVVNIYTELPAAQGLEAQWVKNNPAVVVNFTMPADAADYGFISNSLMIDNAQLGESETTDINATSLNCELTEGNHTIYILTRYKYGIVKSAPITVNYMNNPPVSTGICTVVTADSKAQSAAYDLTGRRISTLNKGVMILNGKKVVK